MAKFFASRTNYLIVTAIGCAVASFFVTLFFIAYLGIKESFAPAIIVVPVFVYSAVINSDYRTRITKGK